MTRGTRPNAAIHTDAAHPKTKTRPSNKPISHTSHTHTNSPRDDHDHDAVAVAVVSHRWFDVRGDAGAKALLSCASIVRELLVHLYILDAVCVCVRNRRRCRRRKRRRSDDASCLCVHFGVHVRVRWL